MPTGKLIEHSAVISNTKVAEETYLIKIGSSHIAKKINPGQFINISIGTQFTDHLLKRPFSVYDTGPGHLSILYKVKGAVTGQMTDLKKGDKLEMVGPLGNTFSNFGKKTILLVGGGIGIAPLMLAAKTLKKKNKLIILHGVRTKKEAISWGQTKVKTHIDENKGHFVCEETEDYIKKYSVNAILTCGPIPMMKRIAEVARLYNVFVEASLEARMACGFGACVGCAIESKQGFKKVCTDGPVFKGEELW
ncbi:MAG: dihydroorotate dehydrogenase electron transfer subunit [Candidatus Margulisbacteria bacterium]|nr:dihydroorotate dehydrogenase electron transfer subunit [Candidatus Margulisiibacteriota bacterium]